MSSTVPSCTKQPTPDNLDESSDLTVAVRVAQQLLATFGSSKSDGFSYPEAYGALRESLRLVLRSLGAEPVDEKGSGLVRTPGSDQRCPAAHPDDPTPCGGPVAVTVLDADNAGANGCEHHGARLLASLDGGRVYALPDAPEGAAIRTFKAADTTRPFCWYDGPRVDPSQLSRAENRHGGEGK
ncbi:MULTISPECIES: hypothetical protein [Streptomyces]|uniref:Uncharacterized protein n=1 Tax=Streptomyces dengpaensis TaxID=2049881 RepID=A0ABM6SSZ2_9ACTN|nr:MULTISPECIES: hypothetical protein [Streptomyces]AVH57796.1 hypothetical protein C4B68_20740 [Streptomyces dengpaensis]PIA98565.1 hypothetical protein B1C81_39460 [Streptomyces sp. HG99]